VNYCIEIKEFWNQVLLSDLRDFYGFAESSPSLFPDLWPFASSSSSVYPGPSSQSQSFPQMAATPRSQSTISFSSFYSFLFIAL